MLPLRCRLFKENFIQVINDYTADYGSQNSLKDIKKMGSAGLDQIKQLPVYKGIVLGSSFFYKEFKFAGVKMFMIPYVQRIFF